MRFSNIVCSSSTETSIMTPSPSFDKNRRLLPDNPLAPREIESWNGQERWISDTKDAPRLPTFKDVDSATMSFPNVLLSFSSNRRRRFDRGDSLFESQISLPSSSSYFPKPYYESHQTSDKSILSNSEVDNNEDRLADEEVEQISLLTTTANSLPFLPQELDESTSSTRRVLPMRRSRNIFTMLEL